MPAFDAHTHIFAPGQVAAREALAQRDPTFAELYSDPAAKLATGSDLLSELDRAGLIGAAAAGFAFASQRDLDEQNAHILETAAAAPGRVATLATVNPTVPGWEGAASAALSAGARGFGELRPGNQGWDPLGPESHRLCALAESAGVPLLWHVSEPVGHAYPGKGGGLTPAQLIALALDHPGLPMIAAHLGGGASFYLQMPEIKASLTNLYFDTAAAFLLYDETSITRLVDLAGPDRVLFASDYPLLSPRRQLERVQALLPGGLVQAVCGGNAQSLFFGLT
ncbi:MAG TPA: amidohydrolase family protein [Tepidiformaceae bacterium]|nr:amidohydrolase family protein [Tepidiformaceae bacterium]